MNYAKNQLEKLNKKTELVTIKVSDFEGNETNAMGLDYELARELRQFINSHLQNDCPKVMTFEISYHGPTNTKGSRISIKSFDLIEPKKKTISRDFETNWFTDQAEKVLKEAGFQLLGKNCNAKKALIFAEWNFDTLKKFFKVEE
jgi:hypothetical protein